MSGVQGHRLMPYFSSRYLHYPVKAESTLKLPDPGRQAQKSKIWQLHCSGTKLQKMVRVSLSWRHDGQAKFMPILSPPPPRDVGRGGRGGRFERVTFNVSVKCLYDDTNSLPTKYIVFKPKMAQKQNLFDIQIKLYYKDLNYYPSIYFPTMSKKKNKLSPVFRTVTLLKTHPIIVSLLMDK